MIRLNVKKDGKVQVKSIVNKKDLQNYVLHFIGLSKYNFTETANRIWDLNVGTALKINGYVIAMAGKSRAGDIMLGGK